MAPFDSNASEEDLRKKFAYLLKTPKSLKLEFSKAADYDRINRMFDSFLLKQVDPSGHIAKRLEPDFRRAVNGGNAVFLGDEDKNIRTLAVNYQMHENENHAKGAQHDYTELGSVLSCMQGYRSGFLLTAVITLKEWWCHPPKKCLFTEIKHNNVAPIKIYKTMGWKLLIDKKEINNLFFLCYKNVADDNGKPVSGPPLAEKNNIGFYRQVDSALAIQARVILDYMDQGGVTNKAGNLIPVDFSDLEHVGLTRPRLEAIAKGETSRQKLRRVDNSPSI